MTIYSLGDSITVGVNASPNSLGYAHQLFDYTQKAVSGDQIAEQSKAAQSINPVANDRFTLMVGTNDIRTYKDDATKKGYFEAFYRQALVWLLTPGKVKARDAGMAYTGSWSNTAANTFGKVSTALNATAQATVSGEAVYVGFILQAHSATVGSLFKVEVDGVDKGTYSCNGAGMNTVNGSTYAGAALRIAGLSPGGHTVKVTVLSTGKNVYLDYIAGSAQAYQPQITVGNIIPMSTAAYTGYGISDATTLAYNALIGDLVIYLETDGFVLGFVDAYFQINTATDLAVDGVHPNNQGHGKLYDAFKVVV